MQYEILTSGSPKSLTEKVNECIKKGWKPIGSHIVTTLRDFNRFSGTQHMDTRHDIEYSQTMIKESVSATNIRGIVPHADDIRDVANDLNITLVEGCVEYVQNGFDAEALNDPTATWDIIVENLIYQFKNKVD